MTIKAMTKNSGGRVTSKSVIWDDELRFADVSNAANGVTIRASKEYPSGDEDIVEITLDGIDFQEIKKLLGQ